MMIMMMMMIIIIIKTVIIIALLWILYDAKQNAVHGTSVEPIMGKRPRDVAHLTKGQNRYLKRLQYTVTFTQRVALEATTRITSRMRAF